MTNLFNYLYYLSKNKNSFLSGIRFYSFLRMVVRISANFALPIYFRLTAKDKRHRLNEEISNINHGVVISLTSFPGRIDRVWLVVETLLRQTKKPNAIIIWLSKEQFPKIDSLPKSLLAMRKRGLQIKLRDGDLRSHKKFYYVKSEFPNSTVVLADDDIFYPSKMLEEMHSVAILFPGKVVCRFSKKVQWSPKGEIFPYSAWKTVNEGGIGLDYFFGSGGGVLIPPKAMHPAVLDKDTFLKCCPLADDIWLNVMCRLVSLEMFSIDKPFTLLPVTNRDKSDLSSINNGAQMNDEQLTRVRKYCREVHGIDPYTAL